MKRPLAAVAGFASLFLFASALGAVGGPAAAGPSPTGPIDAAQFGFLPEASGAENTRALQQAVDRTGTIVVNRPGTYRIAGTVFVGSHTTLDFGSGVLLQKTPEQGPFTHVLLNKGALTRSFDRSIVVRGLQIAVNGVDVRRFLVHGLHGQLAFFHVKDLRIERFRCLDLGKAQFGIHVCTFEDLVIDDVMIRGDKDGVHLGRGKRFTIRNGVFETYDDAIALNGHDYDVSNPELGWIEDGVVENCHDRTEDRKHVGYFCRILAGAWTDWRSGMEVQKSDTVVSNGRLYRVAAQADGVRYVSTTQPTHEAGSLALDGITWVMVQNDVTYTAGVRDVVFRDIFLEKGRIGFSVHFDNDKFSRSYYPGAAVPMQERLLFDNIRVQHDARKEFLSIGTPVDAITIVNSVFADSAIRFHGNKAMTDYRATRINLVGCTFRQPGALELLVNSVPGKRIRLRTSASVELHDDFSARVSAGPGTIEVDSDLTGLRR